MEDKRIWHWFGLDVSKDSFTACYYNAFDNVDVPAKRKSFDINDEGVAAFLKWRSSQPYSHQANGIVLEATGPYSLTLAKIIRRLDAKARISLCNPQSVKNYRECHTREKNDALDAVYIARYGFDSQPREWVEGSETEQRLKSLERQRAYFVVAKGSLMRRAETEMFEDMACTDREMAMEYERKIKDIEKEMGKLVAADPKIKAEVGLMCSVPGVGMLSATVIYAELGSLSGYTRRELSALSGVCPCKDESGVRVGKGHVTRRGPKEIRRILYMDTNTSANIMPSLVALKQRLLSKENSRKMTAKCACMRKLLLTLRGIIVSGKPYDPEYCGIRTSVQKTRGKQQKKS